MLARGTPTSAIQVNTSPPLRIAKETTAVKGLFAEHGSGTRRFFEAHLAEGRNLVFE